LKIRNIKNLASIDIEVPDAPVIYITGPSEAGKSTVLDTIMMAWQGKRKIPGDTVKHGEDSGDIVLELDDGMTIKRHVVEGGGSLQVLKDGFAAKSPQAMLDKLMGPISMNPWPFVNGTPSSRRELILEAAGIGEELLAVDGEDEVARDERRLAKRALKALEAQLEAAPELDENVPAEPVDSAELMQKKLDAITHNTAIKRRDERFIELNQGVDRLEGEAEAVAEKLQRDIEELQQKASQERARIEGDINSHCAGLEEIRRWQSEHKPADVEAIRQELLSAQAINSAVAEQATTRALVDERQARVLQVEEFEQAVADVGVKRQALMAKVAVALPVEGLSVDDEDITIDGITYMQLSTGRRVRVAVALAVKESPEFRLVRITDGSLLDAAARDYLDRVGRDENLQFWVEDVRETGEAGLELSIAPTPWPAAAEG
jgi:ABC-type dipeptide/oligopeptide/nickel transport system ATPase component